MNKIYFGFIIGLVACMGCKSEGNIIRVGYLANLTHAPALVGLSKGIYQKALPENVRVNGMVFNAGPSVVEGIFSGSIDIGFVGPAPAINCFVRSGGNCVIIAGVTEGGSGVVVAKDRGIQSISDLKDRPILTPQLGNTQDVVARSFFKEMGWPRRVTSGLRFIPVANPDQLNLFRGGDADAAWAVEPWLSRLVVEGNGQILFDEQSVWDKWTGTPYPTTVLVVRKEFLEKHPDWVQAWLNGHIETIEWIQAHSEEAKNQSHSELKRILGKGFLDEVITAAWPRLHFTWRIYPQTFDRIAKSAAEIGFLKDSPDDFKPMIETKILKITAKKYRKGA